MAGELAASAAMAGHSSGASILTEAPIIRIA
jgi:hypothetical protein